MIPPRKFLVSLVVVTLGNFQLNSAEVDIAPLIQEASGLGAPFTGPGLTRLRSANFGENRAVRSTDVIIYNKSSKSFRIIRNDCEWGGFSDGLFPEHALPNRSSTVYGIESNGFMSGAECNIKYSNNDGSWFSMFVDNPYIGRNVLSHDSSSNLQVSRTQGIGGTNSQARFTIEDA